ncbi:DUF1289 domain containing protein [Nitzschia inconspicua]|uniref:DUF1289 domain containing protein n=1 Tax=Nitzschia inconspicua TaxID=303405 RepID=A0A9K3LNI4_9STRA|nr:DUF1289 domain containing protein [Nitzschia inconspicua]
MLVVPSDAFAFDLTATISQSTVIKMTSRPAGCSMGRQRRSGVVTRLHASNQDDDTKIKVSQTPSEDVPLTPCNRICRYNANVFDGQVCIGCFRETYEIAAWQSMSPKEKYFALLDAKDRLQQRTISPNNEVDGAISMEDLERQARFWKEQVY